jgi:hypothetical protein
MDIEASVTPYARSLGGSSRRWRDLEDGPG